MQKEYTDEFNFNILLTRFFQYLNGYSSVQKSNIIELFKFLFYYFVLYTLSEIYIK